VPQLATLTPDPAVSKALHSPAAIRNRDPILAVLRRVLPPSGTVLEVASGSGEHVLHFAAAFPQLTWQPSDCNPEALASIQAHAEPARLANVAPPLQLDASAASWPISHADAVLAINLVHISPWRTTEGLLAGAARILPEGGVLYLYGPYRESGAPMAPSNVAFDESLRLRNPEWGVRTVSDVADLAKSNGFDFVERVAMPANNLSLIFRLM
jgi:SAM-dependent methyltransferase